MIENASLSGILRVIGQHLNALKVEAFRLQQDGDDIVVQVERAGKLPSSPLRSAMKFLGVKLGGDAGNGLSMLHLPTSVPVEIRYTPADVGHLDEEGKTFKGLPAMKPDSSGLPEVLRLVGHYLDHKQAPLISVAYRDGLLTIQYEMFLGHVRTEQHRVSSFHDLSIHMYLKRKDRQSPP